MEVLSQTDLILFCVALVVVAFLYASVGHGGASGYLALMALIGVPIAVMKPSALLLNLFVSSISFLFYYRKNFFKPKLFFPFAVSSVPAAFLGGYISIDSSIYKVVLGIVLVFAALRLLGLLSSKQQEPSPMYLPLALTCGAAIGLLSGMLGIGGGIILSPVLLLLGWASIKEAAAISSLFIFVNSLAGISGYLLGGDTIPLESAYFVPVAILGGMFGAYYGSGSFSNKTLQYVLGVVILLASVKLIFP